MNKLFLLCISLSLSGSLVVLLLILSRSLIRRIGKTWQYYLWLLVVLRLLIPFSPDTNLVGGVFRQVETQFVLQNPATDTPTLPFSATTPPSAPPDLENGSPVPVAATRFPLQDHIVGIVWIIPAIILLIRKIAGYSQFVKVVKQEGRMVSDGQLCAALQTVCTAMGIRRKIALLTNSLVRAPMLVGMIHPVIVLPTGKKPLPELMLILRHELTHYRRMDLLYKWLAEIVVCLHWYNPLVYWVRKQITQDCEFSCDEAVIAGLEIAERQTYGETLLHSIVVNPIDRMDVVSLALNKDGKFIQERLFALQHFRRNSKWIVFIATILTAVLFCGTIYAGAYSTQAVENANITRLLENKAQPAQISSTTAQTVVYESAAIRHNEGQDEFDHISTVRANHTTQKIVSCNRAMLAFDQAGNPLKLDWWARDDELNYHYSGIHAGLTRAILPGQKDEQSKGWRLNPALDPQVQKVAFVLVCDTQITFEDGSVWENPEYERWRSTYEGKKTDVNVLKNYYPYEQKIASKNNTVTN